MGGFKQQSLRIAVSAILSAPSIAFACSNCSSMQSNTNALTGLHNGLAESVAVMDASSANGFAATSQALSTMSFDVIDAVNSSTALLQTEMIKASKIEVSSLSSISDRLERLAKTKLVAETNLETDKTHGAKNIPQSLCSSYASVETKQRAIAVAREVMEHYKETSVLHTGSQVKGFDSFGDAINDALAEGSDQLKASFLGRSLNKEDSMSMLYISNYISGLAAIEHEPGKMLSARDSAQRLRAQLATEAIAVEIARKTVPDVEEGEADPARLKSISEDLYDGVMANFAESAQVESATASEVKLLRSLVTNQALALRIQYNSLESSLSQARLNGAMVGQSIDRVAND